jgi:hypothetical protein
MPNSAAVKCAWAPMTWLTMLPSRVGALLTLMAGFGLGQVSSPVQQRAFEVATIKPAAPLTGGALITKRLDGQQVSYRHITLKMLLMEAWQLKHYQIRGPSLLEHEYYDIVAKFEQNTDANVLPELIQGLLGEEPNKDPCGHRLDCLRAAPVPYTPASRSPCYSQ